MKAADHIRKLMEAIEEPVDEGFETVPKYVPVGMMRETHPRLPMQWSIWKDTSPAEYEDWVYDLSANAPDGQYKVIFDYLGNVGESDGVVVRDGAFDVVPTLKAVKSARDEAGYWGDFLERLEYDPARKAFVATIGS